MKNIFVVTGQTATGKTAYALKLAQEHNGELINCDSRQVYKRLDIITGKDLTDHTFHLHKKIHTFEIGSYNLTSTVPIWLYDIVYPDQQFSSFEYAQCATEVIKDIIDRGKTPIIVGGSYFYLKHLLYGFETQIEADWELRKELEAKTVSELQQLLQKLNAEEFNKLNNSDKNNPRRLVRRIEVQNFKSNAKPVTNEGILTKYSVDIIGFRFLKRDKHRQAIIKRVNERLKNSAVDEVKNLLRDGYSENNPGLQTIGYSQVIKYLSGKISEEKMKDEWITREAQYAKRQYTFMKTDQHISWKEI